jgi:hypothetical protein
MAAGATYTQIATTTLSSAQSSVTFSSISGSYTDLVLVTNGKMSAGSAVNNKITFNSDTGTNYSRTYVYGDGSSALSGRDSSQDNLGFIYWSSTNPSTTIIQIQNYSNTTTYKTALARTSESGVAAAYVGLWRSTSAITSITITRGSTNDFASGSTFSLYGITAA